MLGFASISEVPISTLGGQAVLQTVFPNDFLHGRTHITKIMSGRSTAIQAASSLEVKQGDETLVGKPNGITRVRRTP